MNENKRVNKIAIFKMCKDAGLTPIEDSWEVRKSHYSGWNYSGYEYYYDLNTTEGVKLTGDKISDVSFSITCNNRDNHKKAKVLQNLMSDYGYACSFRVDFSTSLRSQVNYALMNRKLYDDELIEILQFINNIGKDNDE